MTERVVMGGTDGFRGEATEQIGPGQMNEETVAGLTYALVGYRLENGMDGPVVVARDTRPSSAQLARAATCGALAHGVDVLALDVAPTPMAQKVGKEVGALATVVITASHNPAHDNGWKGMVGSDKPSKKQVEEISRRYWEQVDSGLVIPEDRWQNYRNLEQGRWYIDTVVENIEEEFGTCPLLGKIFVVDGAYGAAQNVTPQLLRRLGAQVEEFACDGEGVINEGCGAADLSGLKRYLMQRPELLTDSNFIGALANDGDADRMMAIGVIRGKRGVELVEVNGNHAMYALAQGQPGIVGTEYTNSGLVRRLEQENVQFEYCPNGDVYVTEALKAKQAVGEPWARGGEFTGHHVDLTWLSSGDGVRMAAWLASWTVQQKVDFGEIYQQLPLWTEAMAKVKFPHQSRNTIQKVPQIQETLEFVEDELGEEGRVILRPSGTEPVVRIWAEGIHKRKITNVVRVLKRLVEEQVAA